MLFLSCALAALAGGATNPPVFKCAPGWRAEIVAQAPAIQAPSVLCCAPDGRIFMGEDPNDMGSPTDKPGDRIVCIYPDGKIKVFANNLYGVFGMQYLDGKLYVHHSPKFSVFDDDHGVGVNRVDLIASDNPHPWLPSFNDHIPSGIRLAMDGYFYITTGDKGILGAVGTDGRKLEMRGGIFRMRPDGTGLEVYCTGTRNHMEAAINSEDEMFTLDNTDDGGGWWTRLTHMVDGGYYGYPFDFKPQRPYTLWMMTDFGNAGGAPTGALCYNEDALPQEYRGNLFLCDWAGDCVERVITKRSGATYDFVARLDRHCPLTSADYEKDFFHLTGFKPVGITVTPDGMGFYVTDWGLSGWKRNDIVGRLFKLTYTGKSLAAPKPDWYVPAASGQKFKASTRDLVQALSHPSYNVRMVAQRRLADRGKEGERKLASLVKNSKAPPCARWSAIWTLDAIDGGKKEHKAILSALKARDATVQAQAARELGARQVKEAVPPLIAMLDSTNAMLRFRAATALGRIADRAAVKSLQDALAQKDFFARYAAFKALNRIGLSDAVAWPRIVEGFASAKPEIREGVLFATRETYDVGLVKALAAFLSKPGIPTEPRTNVLNLLSSLYFKAPPWNGDWWNTMPVMGLPPAKTLSWEGSPVIAAAMRGALQDSQLAVRQIVFDWVRLSHDTNAAAMLRTMFERETDVAMRATILRALPGGNDPDSRALIGPILKNPQVPVVLLEAAIDYARNINGAEFNDDLVRLSQHPGNDRIMVSLFECFGKRKLPQATRVLGKNLAGANPAIQNAAIEALTQIGGDPAILELMRGMEGQLPAVRQRCIEALGALRARAAVPWLIKLSADSQLSTSAIQALTRMPDLAALDIYLDGLVSKNAAVRSQCKTAVTSLRDAGLPRIEARLASTNGLPDDAIASLREIYQHDTAAKRGRLFKVKVKPVPEYQSFALAHPGNARHGQSIFSDANGVNCVKCHAINGQGGHIGPELTGLGARQTRPQIIESVLYPSKVILDGYQQILFYMTDDEDYSGIVRSETADTVMVIDSLGVTNLLEKSKIKSRKISQISLMPEGLQTGLSLQDFSDLIAFVENSGAGMPQRNPGDMAARPPGPEPLPPDPMDFLNMSPSPLAIPAAPAMPAASMMPPEPIPGPHPHGRRGPVNPLAPPMPPGFPVPPKPPQQRLNNPPAASTFRGL
jgi:putative heme-binding domain-containing protein